MVSLLTRFNIDFGGCYATASFAEKEEREAVHKIGWFVIMGGEIRQYECTGRDGKRMTIVVCATKSRYEGEDLEIWLWDWGRIRK